MPHAMQRLAIQLPANGSLPAALGMVAALVGIGIFAGVFLLAQRRQSRHFSQLLDALPDGILQSDRYGRIVGCNAAAAELLHLEPQHITGKLVHDLLHYRHAASLQSDSPTCAADCKLQLALAGHASITCAETLHRTDRSSVPVEFILTPWAEGFLVTLHDVTERQALEHSKDEFVSTVSHELRTPLTSIRGALGLLSAGLLGEMSEKAANLLRIAVSNTDRLVRLINDLLDLERMASGRSPLHLRRCSMKDIIQQSIETMAPMADAAMVQLVAETDALNLTVDPDRIQQVLTNLLSNAIKFSAAGSVVEITQTVEADFVHLQVRDQGRGIPAEMLESIFDRFQQIHVSDARQKGGSGLGLAICRHIMQQHGGRIWATQAENGGSILHLHLPSHATPNLTAPHVGSQTLQLRRGATVLVCDDDEHLRGVVANHLRMHGYHLLEASRGEQVLALADETPIDVILLDLYMPGLSGWETLQRLRKNPATAEIPVVILSILSPTEQPRVASNAAGWVQKPFNENLLLNELSRVLRHSDGPCRVLLVEDDADLAHILISSFEGTGIIVDHALTRTAALHYFETQRPEIVILDLTLPDGDGFGLVDWMRQQVDFRTLPLVVYSGHEVTLAERSQLVLGPTEFLTKAKVQPQDVEELVLTMLRQFHHVPAADNGNAPTADSKVSL